MDLTENGDFEFQTTVDMWIRPRVIYTHSHKYPSRLHSLVVTENKLPMTGNSHSVRLYIIYLIDTNDVTRLGTRGVSSLLISKFFRLLFFSSSNSFFRSPSGRTFGLLTKSILTLSPETPLRV